MDLQGENRLHTMKSMSSFKIAPDHKASWVIDQQPSVLKMCGTSLLGELYSYSVSEFLFQ